MATTSGLSHAVAAFLSIIIGALLSNFLSAHSALLNRFSEGVGGVIVGITGISLSEDVTGLLLVSTVLAFFWGVAYHHARHRQRRKPERENNYMTANRHTESTGQMSTSSADSVPNHERMAAFSYQTVHDVRDADEHVLGKLQQDISTVKSRLDDAHDRYHDADDQERLKHVNDLLESVTSLERDVAYAPEFPESANETREIDAVTRRKLLVAHTRLCEAPTDLLEVLDELERSETSESTVDEQCSYLLRDIERALNQRTELIERLGDTQ